MGRRVRRSLSCHYPRPGPAIPGATAAPYGVNAIVPEPKDRAARRATVADATAVAGLLHDFNTEFSEPVPEVDVLAERVAKFIERGEATFLLAGGGPDGVAEIRLRPSIMTGALDAYLEELYVAPSKRG